MSERERGRERERERERERVSKYLNSRYTFDGATYSSFAEEFNFTLWCLKMTDILLRVLERFGEK